MAWDEVGDRCYRRRYDSFDLNIGVIVGERGALLIDTRASLAEADELIADLRLIDSSNPRWVVNTHAHFDHYFGNARFASAEIWGHESLPAAIAAEDVAALAAEFPSWAGALDPVRLPPANLVNVQAEIDLGDRVVRLNHLGRGHTAGDLVVIADDVVFAGDLVEESAPPAFGSDCYPLEWPETLDRLLALRPSVVVPGHGDAVDAAFVQRQGAEITAAAHRIRSLAGLSVDQALAAGGWPYEPDVLASAVQRGFDSLRG